MQLIDSDEQIIKVTWDTWGVCDETRTQDC